MERPLTSEEREIAYEMGYDHYNEGAYRKAKHLFLTLVTADPTQPLYWKGYAASLQMEDRYEESAQAWAMVALLNERDPLPHVHAAECLLALGESGEARAAVALARDRIKCEDEMLKTEIERIEAWLSNMS